MTAASNESAGRLSHIQVINILEQTRPHHPNFALLLGAGASRSSGVRTASELIREWRIQFAQCRGVDPDSIKRERWYGSSEEYSILFESLYHTASQRREIVESWLVDARPSWGYVCLASLLQHRVFRVVFTTNFDDLLQEACYLYTDKVRPIVCAHDSAVSTLRLTSDRPKIIKLHGDFLFENIKNTTRELESLGENTRKKFQQFCCEFGLLVVGYGGQDRSVMDVMDSLLRRSDAFPHGVYWGVLKGSQVPPEVELLQRFENFYVFEIDGFDNFFADVHEKLGLRFPTQVSSPERAGTDRATSLLKAIEEVQRIDEVRVNGNSATNHPASVAKQLLSVKESLERYLAPTKAKQAESPDSGSVSSPLVTNTPTDESSASSHFRELSIDEMLSSGLVEARMRELWRKKDHAEAKKLAEPLIKTPAYFGQDPSRAQNIALCLIHLGLFDDAIRMLESGRLASLRGAYRSGWDERVYLINRCQILRHQNNDLSAEDREQLRSIQEGASPPFKLATCLLLQQYEDAEKWYEVCLSTGAISDGTAGREPDYWPLFRLFQRERVRSDVVKRSIDSMFGDQWKISPFNPGQ